MVKVLSTGEVVADDDPRARQGKTNAQTPSGPNSPQYFQNQAAASDNLTSIWNSGNDRLRQMGLETFHVAGYRVDPLHLVAAVIGFLFSGPMMLAVIVAVILVSQSRSDNPVPVQQPRLGGGAERGRQNLAQDESMQPIKKPKDFGPFSGTGKRLGS